MAGLPAELTCRCCPGFSLPPAHSFPDGVFPLLHLAILPAAAAASGPRVRLCAGRAVPAARPRARARRRAKARSTCLPGWRRCRSGARTGRPGRSPAFGRGVRSRAGGCRAASGSSGRRRPRTRPGDPGGSGRHGDHHLPFDARLRHGKDSLSVRHASSRYQTGNPYLIPFGRKWGGRVETGSRPGRADPTSSGSTRRPSPRLGPARPGRPSPGLLASGRAVPCTPGRRAG